MLFVDSINDSIHELSNEAIVYSNKNGVSIYNKIKNKYIFSYYIITYENNNIFQYTKDYFIIYDLNKIYKCFIKDYSLVAYDSIFDKFYNSCLKINNNIIIFYKGYNECCFSDINTFTIIYNIKLNGELKELILLKGNKYLFSIDNELYLGWIQRKENKFDFIFDFKLEIYLLIMLIIQKMEVYFLYVILIFKY